MNQHSFVVGDRFVVDEVCDERDRPHFPQQRRVEADLVDPTQYLRRSHWHIRALSWIYVYDDYVAGFTIIDQRKERRIADIAAIPIVFAVDLYCLIEIWQACGREHACNRDLAVGEDARLAGADIRCTAK